ncbi:hypothetical protein [Bradyrhizobium sp.]|uniref:hypothetical protein n=1 Tax=Bradyrhizobium sp. TaxID=376 RepID=UPI0025BB46EC|nr:hypothetical protein [Bradyrhizobium sp.]
MSESTGRILNALIAMIFVLGGVQPIGAFLVLWTKHELPGDKQTIFDLTACAAAA